VTQRDLSADADPKVTSMRIAMFQPTFNSTTIGWVQGLEELGHHVVNVLPGRSGGDPVGGVEGIQAIEERHIVVLPNQPWSRRLAQSIGRLRGARKVERKYAFPSPLALRRLLAQSSTDVVLIKDHSSLQGISASLVAASLGIARLQWYERPPQRWSLRSRVLTRLAILPRAVFTTNDPRPGGVALPDGPLGHVRIPYGAPRWPAPSRESSSADPSSADPIRILTVASFKNARKRPWWTLEAARRSGILGGDRPVRFTFVGAGSEASEGYRRVRELAEELGISDDVELLARIPYSRMWEVFDGHHLMVLPCQEEPFGMSVVEALARGIPVVLSEDAGSVGCVLPGVTGAVFPADDLEGLARSLAELVPDRARLAVMSEASAAFVDRHLATGVVARQLEVLLADAVAGRRAG